MDTKGIIIIVAIAVLVGFGGYLLGTKNSGNGPAEDDRGNYGGAGAVKQGAGAYQGSVQPVDRTEVLSELKKELEARPDDFELLTRIANTYFETMKFDEAYKYYKSASEVNPGDVNTYNNLGLSSHYLGNSAKGIAHVDEGIKRNPYFQRIWLTKGFILAYGMGNEEEAVKSWEKCMLIAPDTPAGKAAGDYIAAFKGR
jgi:tetratricopeptide (TPR) repeat protein